VTSCLPSGGGGAADLLAARRCRCPLTKIFRQAPAIGIVVNAHRINAGQLPGLREFGDFFMFGCEEAEDTAALVVDIVARRIRPSSAWIRGVRCSAVPDAPRPPGREPEPAAAEALTPLPTGSRNGGTAAGVPGRDKVTQLRNNYDKGAAGVFNGTVGVVAGLSAEDRR